MAERKIIIIGNPVAGGGALGGVRRAVRALNDKGYDVELLLTEKRGDAVSFARRAAAHSARDGNAGPALVIAAGGDGTYNEVANGLAYSDTPMAILPLGTTSVLAYELSVPHDPDRALDIALTGRQTRVHLGRLTLAASGETRYFLLMTSVGFDGEVVMNVNERIKRISGRGAYILSGVKVLLGYRPPALVVTDTERSMRAYTVIVGKAACYGGALKVAKDARLTDPSFYVFATHRPGRLALIKYVAGIVTGTHLGFKDIAYFRTEALEVIGDAPVQVDGDYVGSSPAKIEIARDALTLLMPDG